MAARRRPHERDVRASTPAQQDEADIVAEVGAERDEDVGELVADEEKIRAIGAVDAESVRENRRLNDLVDKKRGNVKGVPFNAGDLLTKYETLIKFWPVNTIDISVKRLTGQPVQHMITSRPRSGVELYEAIKAIHGQCEEAKYELKFFDNNSKEFRGNGQITMPDTRAATPQQGQPMQYPYNPFAPPGAPIPPGYPPGYAVPYPYPVPPGYPQPPQQAQQPPPAAQPAAAQAAPAAPQAPTQMPPQMPPQVFVQPPPPAPGLDIASLLAFQKQLFEMLQSVQPQHPPQPPQPQYAPQPQPPPMPMPMMMPMPMPAQPGAPAQNGFDLASLMALQKQVFEMLQSAQPQAAPAPAPGRGGSAQPQQPQPPPQMAALMGMMGMPPMSPPPGTIWVPGFGFVPLDRLTQAISPGGPGGAPPYRGRPPYGPGGGAPYPGQYPGQYPEGAPGGPYGPRGPGGPPGYGPPGYGPPGYGPPGYGPPQREKTAAEQFREAMGVVRTAVETVQDLNAMIPGAMPGVAAPPQEGDGGEESPIQVIDTGPAKLVINKEDGSLRKWETGWANMDKVFKWVGEQREALTKAAVERRAEERRQQQPLPPGYVEVGPGYQPPPGYVAVPADPRELQAAQQQQHALPPPPADVPPPISQPQQPPQRPMWGMPTVPFGNGEG